MSHFYPHILSLCLLLAACVGDEGSMGEGIEPGTSGEKVAVSFNSRIDLATQTGMTRAGAATEELLTDGVQVVVYAYRQDAIGTPSADPEASCRYTVSGADGSLTESGDGDVMYLAAGRYSFYALSVNTATQPPTEPPTLANGSQSETGELANNIDYIYCATNTAIASIPDKAQTVSLSFSRLSVRVVLNVVGESTGTGKITAADKPTIKLAATNPSGSKITLGAEPAIAPGVPVTGESNYPAMSVEGELASGFTAGYILLPMREKQDIAVTITFPSITIEGLPVQTNKLYTLTLKTPDGGFVSGNQYSYKVTISGNDVVFQGVTITDWTGKDGSMPDSDITEDFDDVKQQQP